MTHGDDQGRRQDRGADHGHLRILHVHTLQRRGNNVPDKTAGGRWLTIETNGDQQERASQDPGQLGRQIGQAQAVLKNGDGQKPEAMCPVRSPRPPKIDVPPSTTAVIAASS